MNVLICDDDLKFVQQIKNPYHFKCGRFTVQASFSAEGATLEECIKGILR